MDSSPPENLYGDRKKAIQGLIQGRELANQLRNIIGNSYSSGDDKSVVADDLVMKIQGSFTEIISILNRRPAADQELSDQIPGITAMNSPSFHGRKSEDSEGSSKSTSVLKKRRGCYNRRKTTQTWTRITPNLIDDGHAWRKYGQKDILNANHPRNYYRCTHKFDQDCQATKQVQRTEDDPPMYRTTYHGNHTCQNHLKPAQIILDSTTPNSVLLSFGSSSIPNTNFDEPYYPTLPFTKHQQKPSLNHKQMTDRDNHNYFPFSDLTVFDSSGSDHGDVISSPGVYSCTASTRDDSHSFDIDDMMAEVGDFDDFSNLIFD